MRLGSYLELIYACWQMTDGESQDPMPIQLQRKPQDRTTQAINEDEVRLAH